MSRIYNFSAGPATLPEEVLQQAAAEMLDWHGAGCGVMEMSHRGKDFTQIITEAEADLRELMQIPADYRVLFLQGGATQQFSQIVMNLLDGGEADYIVSGAWSDKAWKEAKRLAPIVGGTARLAGSSLDVAAPCFPSGDQLQLNPAARYVHFCTNETIGGVEVQSADQLPQTAAPLVADMSSHILSRPVDVSRFGMIYAGAQKNIGPSGLVIAIIHDSLLGKAWAGTPGVMDYKVMADNGSMLNTPPTYAIYIAGLVFKWLKARGGVVAIERENIRKAQLLYDFIDGCDFYRNPVAPAYRSRMNIPFTLQRPELDGEFLKGAEVAGLSQLKGHKSVGGMRASIYNAMPFEGVQALVDYMRDFAQRNA